MDKIGMRVVRGPDWSWEDEDGGEGYTGTLYDLDNSDKTAIIQWDNGNQTLCKIGQMDSYELRIIDNAQIGVRHRNVECDECDPESSRITSTSRIVHKRWEDIEHIGIRCDGCKSLYFRGIRYKCANCYDYDLCESCYRGSSHDQKHSFVKINFPNFEGIHLLPRYIQRKRNQEQVAIHRGVRCDGCNSRNIRGTRYKCCYCHNYDLCDFCYYGNKHDLTHKFTKLNRPLGPIIELRPRITFRKNLNEGTEHKGVRCDGCSFVDIHGIRYKCKNCYNYDLCFSCYHGNKHDLSHTFIRVDMPNKSGVYLTPRSIPKDNHEGDTVHYEIHCDSCNVNNIQGIRFNCNVCFNYDLCEICYYGNKHDLHHGFRRIDTPESGGVDLPPRLNPKNGSMHVRIRCDECNLQNMWGIRYKCNNCYNYDLCETCYNANQHDVNHSFKRMDCQNSVGVNLSPRVPARMYQRVEPIETNSWDVLASTEIYGMRYKCNSCDNYDLCYKCYHGDKHHLGHSFTRIKTPQSVEVILPPRSTSRKCQLRGIFKGAKVVKGIDWDNGDGGQDEPGVVLAIHTSNTESSWRSAAYVKWQGGNVTLCRLGYEGYCDIQFIEAALGNTHYYPEHLPVLGQAEEGMSLAVTGNRQVVQEEHAATHLIERLSLNDSSRLVGTSSSNDSARKSGQAAASGNRVKELESQIAQMEESQTCAICLENKRDVVFLCGHGTCSICANSLELCHLCRKTIERKIRIY